ncbi:MAG: hypothetical protein KBS74_03645, partial [Clostridiales bacterium]|nr:hypothetical protein [Candidatus Cacconaster stercorequi]
KAAETYNAEQKKRYARRQARKYERLEAGSVDGENRRKYAEKKTAWEGIIAKEHFTVDSNHDMINKITGARIISPDCKAASEHAERYYGLVRSMQTDVLHISKNTGIAEEEIAKIKSYLFLDEHDLGDGRFAKFDSDFSIAQSWQRLINGSQEPHDITLLRHELLESSLVEKGFTQNEAHIIASSVYNYSKEVRDFYASLEKYKNK